MSGPWSDCPKKHYVREEGWVQAASVLKKLRPRGDVPRLFTFCAEEAIDVYTLLCRGHLPLDGSRFSNVTFCESSPETCTKIGNALPGAVAIPLELQEVVVLPGDEEVLARSTTYDVDSGIDKPVESEASQRKELRIRLNRLLKARFPFDILNFDFCGYLYKNSEKFPGTTFTTLRTMFRWQREAWALRNSNAWCLWLTTKVGPNGLEEGYVDDLVNSLVDNQKNDEAVAAVIEKHLGGRGVREQAGADFRAFFLLGIRKQLASLLHQEGWCLDPEHRSLFIFSRNSPGEGGYEMLHIVLLVRPHPVGRDAWGGEPPKEVKDGYRKGVLALLGTDFFDVDSACDAEGGERYLEKLREVREFRVQNWPDTLM